MDYIIDYIDPILIPIVLCVWCIGAWIKAARGIRDELIPVLLVPAAIVLVGLWTCAGAIPATGGEWFVLCVNSLVQGILCAAVAVWGDQAVKQIRKMKEG